MDFDVLAPGHGRLGTRDHVRQFREYMQDLHGAVLAQVQSRRLPGGNAGDDPAAASYKRWFGYASDNPNLNWFPMNIAGMYRYIQNHRRAN